MGRVRTPSPRRDRERRRSRSRDRDRRVRHRRSHSRSPHKRRSKSKSPHRRRSRSKSPFRRRSRSPVSRKKSSSPSCDRDGIPGSKKSSKSLDSSPAVSEEDLSGLDPDEAEMMKMMGFAGFSSTKGKKVAGNDIFAANIITKRKFRQYMNRRGGFNRPLDFIA